MNVGRFEIEQLSEGIFEVFEDGIIQKIDSSDIKNRQQHAEVKTDSAYIGINPVLIRDGKHNIILETGLGWGLDHKSEYTDCSNLKTNLDIFGLSTSDITHVILSHLHYDHAAGSTFVDEELSTKATLPYANYFIQKKEWYFALQEMQSPTHKMGSGYELDELYRLAADDKLVMITDAQFQLLPGIEIIRTGGHTPGHQIVKIQDDGESAYFLGDLIPSENHLNHYAMRQMDVDPVQAKKSKTLILRQAYEESALLFFYHSIHAKAGILARDKDKNFVLKDVQ